MDLVIITKRKNVTEAYVNECLGAYLSNPDQAQKVDVMQIATTGQSRTLTHDGEVAIETIVRIEK